MFTHFGPDGGSRMVDVSAKEVTSRQATAEGSITVGPRIYALIQERGIAKGDVLEVARVAGIMATKKTAELIPMCHPILIDGVEICYSLVPEDSRITVCVTVTCAGRTGVEMEALAAVSVVLLTIYDMTKSQGKGMVIGDIGLLSKSGGKSGEWKRDDNR